MRMRNWDRFPPFCSLCGATVSSGAESGSRVKFAAFQLHHILSRMCVIHCRTSAHGTRPFLKPSHHGLSPRAPTYVHDPSSCTLTHGHDPRLQPLARKRLPATGRDVSIWTPNPVIPYTDVAWHSQTEGFSQRLNADGSRGLCLRGDLPHAIRTGLANGASNPS